MDMDDDRDPFSDLPDELLFPILTFLPTNSALAASSLSHRWYNQWVSLLHSLPSFDFQTPLLQNSDTLSFVNSVNNLISVNHSPTISKFRLKTSNFNWDYLSRINEWIRFVISKSVIEIDLGITLNQDFVHDFDDDADEGFIRILPCDSLKILKISSNFGLKMPIPASSAFQNLRIFHLDYLESPLYRALVAQLLTNLPLLEELSIRATLWIPEGLMTFNIVAPALKIFFFSTRCHSSQVFPVIVVVDAPLLEKICLDEDFIAVYSLEKCLNISEAKVCVAKHVGAYDYTMVDDSVVHSNNSKAKHLLRGLSNAKSISLSSRAVLSLVILPDIEYHPIVPFPFLTKLELVIPYDCAWKLLMPMLENSPNLEVLILTKREYNNNDDEVRSLEQESLLANLIGEFQFTPPEHLPTCLLLHLKEIEIKGVKRFEEVKVLEYLIENARVLKKLTIHPALATCCQNLPSIPLMKKLELFIGDSFGWRILLPMLSKSPRLEVLVITLEMYLALVIDFDFVAPSDRPMCLSNNFKEMEIRGMESAQYNEVLDYIVNNSKLEKLTLVPWNVLHPWESRRRGSMSRRWG